MSISHSVANWRRKARPVTQGIEKTQSVTQQPYTASKAAPALIHSRLPATHPPSPHPCPVKRHNMLI